MRLPDGSGIEVVEYCARLRPVSLIIAISGMASPEEAFRLSRAGAIGYLSKPHTLNELWAKVEEAKGQRPDLAGVAAASVGHRPMREAQDEVRNVMIDQSLALSGGSRRAAAKLLDVSRQAIQQVIHKRKQRRDKKPE